MGTYTDEYTESLETEAERLKEELEISAQAVGVSHWRRDECLRLQAEVERLRAALLDVLSVDRSWNDMKDIARKALDANEQTAVTEKE